MYNLELLWIAKSELICSYSKLICLSAMRSSDFCHRNYTNWTKPNEDTKLRQEWSGNRPITFTRMFEPRHNILSNVRADIRMYVVSWLEHLRKSITPVPGPELRIAPSVQFFLDKKKTMKKKMNGCNIWADHKIYMGRALTHLLTVRSTAFVIINLSHIT